MPLVELTPKSSEVEDRLAGMMDRIRPVVKNVISDLSGFPENDVLVYLRSCPWRDADPEGTEVVLEIRTCPHEELEVVSDEMIERVAYALDEFGFSAGKGAEVWGQFLPGPWVLIENGEITDQVKHPRQSATDADPA